VSRLRLVVWSICAAGAVALAIFAARQSFARGEPELPTLFAVADFSLNDQDGHTVTAASLRGHVWVASFLFTHCPDVCPLLATKIANLERRLHDEPRVRFVSISVDPEHDDPAALRRFALDHHADLSRWSLLTGDPVAVHALVEHGLHEPMGAPAARDDGRYDIMHGAGFLLVDADGNVRSQYRTDLDGLRSLEHDVRRLAAESR
jgi:protein SCO1/2